MSAADARRGALDAIERILNRGDEADEVLRRSVLAIAERLPQFQWVAIRFVEHDSLVLGPSAGDRPVEGRVIAVPISYGGRAVGDLAVAVDNGLDDADRLFLERVATLVSAHCLVAWDTGGTAWEA